MFRISLKDFSFPLRSLTLIANANRIRKHVPNFPSIKSVKKEKKQENKYNFEIQLEKFK